MPSTNPTTPAEPIMLRSLLIVARDQPELWQALQEEFGGRGEFAVLRDRRQASSP